MIGLLLTIEGDEFHHRVVAKIACLEEIAVQLGRGTVQITLRSDVRQTSLYAPVSLQQTRAETQGLLVTIVGTTTQVQTNERLHTDALRLHVQGSTKGTCTIG